MRLAMLIGIAKQIPCAEWMMAVLMPITRPRLSSSGPPLLPGLSAASVWITLSTRWPVMLRKVRPRALITPAVTVESKPNGLPIATTSWPTRRPADSPSCACGNPEASACTTATSVHGSAPTTRPETSRPSFKRTRTRLEPSHHVMVREQKAVGREQEPRPRPARATPALARDGSQIDDGRAQRLGHRDDHPRIGVEGLLLVDRASRAIGRGRRAHRNHR